MGGSMIENTAELVICNMETQKLDARYLHEKLMSYQPTEYKTMLTNSALNQDFYYGRQWDKAELDENKARGNYTVTINMIQRAIDFVVGSLSSQKPKIKAIPVSPEYTYQCNLAMKIYDWHFEKMRGMRTVRDYIKDAVTDNIAFLFVSVDENGYPVTDLYNFEDVIVDPSSRKPMFEDARGFFIRKTVPTQEAMAKFGITELISAQPSKLYSAGFGAENQIKGTDLVDDKVNQYGNIPVQRVFSSDGKFIELYEYYSKRKVPVVIDGKEIMQTRIVKETLIGYEYIYREVLPASITEYPLVPLYVRKGRNPYGVGIVETLREPQKFANKIHGVMLKNATTIGFPKTLIPKNLVPGNNFEKFKKSFNGNTVMEYNPVGGADAAKSIVTIQGQPISDSIIQMYNSAIGLMEYNTAPKESMGYQSSTRDGSTAGAMSQSKDMILDSMRLLAGNIEDALNQHAKVVLQFTRAFMPEDAIIEITAGMEAIERVALNRKQKLDPSNEESVAQFIEAKKQSGLHPTAIDQIIQKAKDDDSYLDSIADFVVNDSSELKVILVVEPESLNSGKADSEFKTLTGLMQLGVQIPPDVLLKYAPIANKEEIAGSINIVKQLQSEVMSSQEQMKQMQTELQKKDQQLMEMQKQMQLNEHQVALDKIENDTRIKDREVIKDHRRDIKEITRGLSTKADKFVYAIDALIKEFKTNGADENEVETVRNTLLQIANQEGE